MGFEDSTDDIELIIADSNGKLDQAELRGWAYDYPIEYDKRRGTEDGARIAVDGSKNVQCLPKFSAYASESYAGESWEVFSEVPTQSP